MAEALNHYFIDSVVTTAHTRFSPEYTEVCPVNILEQTLTLRAATKYDVIRTITSLKPSRAKDILVYI